METVVTTHAVSNTISYHSALYREAEHGMYSALLTEGEKTYLGSMDEGKRRDSLMGRVVAKYAIASIVKNTFGMTLRLTDIEILPQQGGAPVCFIRGKEEKIIPPRISIAHSGGRAVAIAVDARSTTCVGIDIEPVRIWKEETLRGFLTEDEFTCCASRGEGLMECATRLWCVKEAYLKAIGTGLHMHPRKVSVHIDLHDKSKITIEIQGKIVPAQVVWTQEVDGYIIAGIIL